MPFVEPITIKEALDKIHKKEFLLPAIQREFVWSTVQIERLFDSLLRGYPISSFLFWDVERKNASAYKFYEFIRDYHERDNRHNPKADVSGNAAVTAILDGQQRLTSLYIGIRGSYAFKMPRKRRDNDLAFPRRFLYLNLTKKPIDTDLEHDFRFLTPEEAASRQDGDFWFRVGDILDLKENVDLNEYLISTGLMAGDKAIAKNANRALFALWQTVHQNRTINFFLEKDESLDKVLNIFIRVNSGGTQLNYSDLLLSIATAQWKRRDARQTITEFVDDISGIGDGFGFDKDFVLKSCLVLCDFGDVAFKVDNFNSDNMSKIETSWDTIADALRAAVTLVSSLGYHRDTLTSNYVIIPIAYYLQQRGCPANFATSQAHSDDRKRIAKWLNIALLKRIFSGQPDSVLRPIRDVLSTDFASFPNKAIEERLKGTNKSMAVDDDEIENLLDYSYGQPYTYSVLAFLYPGLDFKNKFHQDHIFPKSKMTPARLRKRGIPEDKIQAYVDACNGIPNLQLIEGIPNQEKSSADFSDWVTAVYPDASRKLSYFERHFIPDMNLGIDGFLAFNSERRRMMKERFRKLLNE